MLNPKQVCRLIKLLINRWLYVTAVIFSHDRRLIPSSYFAKVQNGALSLSLYPCTICELSRAVQHLNEHWMDGMNKNGNVFEEWPIKSQLSLIVVIAEILKLSGENKIVQWPVKSLSQKTHVCILYLTREQQGAWRIYRILPSWNLANRTQWKPFQILNLPLNPLHVFGYTNHMLPF